LSLSSSSSVSLSRVLDSDARAMLEKLRVEFRDGLRVQDGKGGVIDERASGVGVVIDQSTTFTRSSTSAPSTAEGAVVAPPPLRSNNAATAVRRPRKDSSWLSRAAARSTKTPEPSEGGARALTQKSSTSGAPPRGRGRGRSEGKTATVVPRPQGS
jgi:1,2-phenylacetyl-CoA epoxidase PaaB subunit